MHHESIKRQAERSERAAQAARAAVMVRAGTRGESRQGWRSIPAVSMSTGWGSTRGN